jgi:phosphomethylpyrimidine synthase
MKITQDIRADAERMAGMEQMSELFKEKGSAIYVPEAAAE